MTTLPDYQEISQPVEGKDVLESILLPDENVIRIATISSGIYWKSIAMAALFIIALFYSVSIAAYFLIISCLLLLVAYCTKKYMLLAATNQRVIIRAGTFSVEVIQFSYSAIESVELSTMPLGQLLGYASIIITGTGRRRIIIPFVENAAAFRDDVTQKLVAKEK